MRSARATKTRSPPKLARSLSLCLSRPVSLYLWLSFLVPLVPLVRLSSLACSAIDTGGRAPSRCTSSFLPPSLFPPRSEPPFSPLAKQLRLSRSLTSSFGPFALPARNFPISGSHPRFPPSPEIYLQLRVLPCVLLTQLSSSACSCDTSTLRLFILACATPLEGKTVARNAYVNSHVSIRQFIYF